MAKSNTFLKKGDKVLIRTVTYFQAGEFEEMKGGFIKLNKASWVADTGRFTQAVASAEFNEVEMFPEGKPVFVAISAIIDITFLPSLPMTQK